MMNLLYIVGYGALTRAVVDISDPVFDEAWLSEVPFVDKLKPSELWSAFYDQSHPVKTSLPELLRVQSLWTNEYLSDRFGDVVVQTEHDRENRTTDYCGLERMGTTIECSASDFQYISTIKQRTTLREYIRNMVDNRSSFDRYVISMLDESMSKDLPFLPAFSCGLRRQMHPIDIPSDSLHATEIHELNFWLSKGGTVSTIHYDMNHQIMCQIEGSKEWRFWDLRTELEHIPMWSGFYPDSYQSDDSPIDPLRVDLEKYPDFVHAKWSNTTLSPGECLIIPNQHWLHFVRSPVTDGRNIGFSVHVSVNQDGAHERYDCDEKVKDLSFSNLGQFQTTWPFPGDVRESGYNKIRMGQPKWKPYAVYAIKQLAVRGTSIEDTLSELTDGRSRKSKRIKLLLDEIRESNDLHYILNFGPLWREATTLMDF